MIRKVWNQILLYLTVRPCPSLASLCLFSALDWLDNDQSLVDISSLRPGLTDWSDWMEPWYQCWTRPDFSTLLPHSSRL